MITVTLHGKAYYFGSVYADGVWIGNICHADTTEASIPNNTRLLSALVTGDSDNQPDFSEDDEPGVLIRLSSGFITGSHWKCSYSGSYDNHNHAYHWDLAYNDTDWPKAELHTWPLGEHDLHPAEYITGGQFDSDFRPIIYCRGWVSKYIVPTR